MITFKPKVSNQSSTFFKLVLLLAGVLFFATGGLQAQTIQPDSDNILYVDKNVTGGDGSGDSWTNAIEELADALKWAREEEDGGSPGWDSSDPLQIWVAEGTYLPMYNAADGSYSSDGGRNNAFVLVPNMQLFGGFDPDGGITDISDGRILPTTMTGTGGTILSGDLDSNDNDNNFDNHTNNAYHVLILPSGLGEAAVNGATIKGGNADGSSTVTVLADGFEQNSGGGVTSQSSIAVEQSVVSRNKASSLGGGVYHYLASDAVYQNMIISENESQFGGGIYIEEGSISASNLLIINNSAAAGGGIYANASSSEMTNTTISQNNASSQGGGIYTYYVDGGLEFTFSNSIVWGNSAVSPGDDIYQYWSDIISKNSLVGERAKSASGTYNETNPIEGDPQFIDPGNGEYKLLGISSAVDAGSDALAVDLNDNPLVSDLGGNTRIANSSVDAGAYEFQGAPFAIEFTKAFDNPANPNGTITLEFTIDVESDVPVTGISFTDDLDVVLSGLVATDLPKSNVCGAGSELSGTSVLTLTGGNIPANDSCTFEVTVQIPVGATPGSYTNTTSHLTMTVSDTPITADPATDDLVIELRPFITTWQVTSGDLDITIPTTGGGYNYSVDWGDDDSDTGINGNATHTYDSEGIYTVEITGEFPRIFFSFGGDKDKILTIEQWGDIKWTSMDNAFAGATNLTLHATDAPDLSSVIGMNNMFRGATSFKLEGDATMNNWDVGNVQFFNNMFNSAGEFNADLSNWDTGSAKQMSSMFYNNFVFNGDLSQWNVINVEFMTAMFFNNYEFQGDLSQWDVDNVKNMEAMFRGNVKFNSDLSGWEVGNVTNMKYMFQDALLFDADLSSWDVRNVQFFEGTFLKAEAFDSDISGWVTESAINMKMMFLNAKSFNQNLGSWDIADVTAMDNMLSGSGLSKENYDQTLIGWQNGTVLSNVTLGAEGLNYCDALEERQDLIDNSLWTFNGDSPSTSCIAVYAPNGNNVLYVNINVDTGAANYKPTGSSWENAVPQLRDALRWADQKWDGSNPPIQLWVADGTYLPTDDDTDRTAIFQLLNNVEIYGGFNGTETNLSDRDWSSNITILSGDIGGDDDPFAPETDSDSDSGTHSQTDHINGSNSYHVVTGSGTDATALLDGFTVTAGLANGSSPHEKGGGLINDTGSPTLTNLMIYGNSADDGGGMFNLTSSNPMLTNVTIFGNSADLGGGIHNLDSSSPVLTNVTISDNSADIGGGIYNEVYSSPTLTNVIIWHNQATTSGSSIYNVSSKSTPVISYSLIEGSGGDGTNNLDVDPQFTDTSNGDYTLQNTSPAINAGINTPFESGGIKENITTDLAGNSRIYDGIPDPDIVDMGAYEFQGEPIDPPAKIVLTAPSDGATDTSLDPLFEWNPAAGANTYNLVVSPNSDVSSPVIDEDGITDSEFQITSNLGFSTMYYWRVRGVNASGDGEWSDTFSFTTIPETSDVVILLDPSDAVTDVSVNPLFDWNTATGADTYDLVVSPNSDFSALVIDETGITHTEFQTTSDLDFSTMYYWRARGVNAGGPGEWSTQFSFTTVGRPTASDGRVLAANNKPYRFAEADFNLSKEANAIKIETLPAEGSMQLDGTPVALEDEISLTEINAEKLWWLPPGDYGYNFTSFDFRAVSSGGVLSTDPYTMTIDLGTGILELTGGEGWRFLGNPSNGSFDDLLRPLWTKGISGSDSPGALVANIFTLNQSDYEWVVPENISGYPNPGQPFIVYVYSDDDNDGTPEGFPKTLTSRDDWLPLDGNFVYTDQLGFDETPNNPNDFYLLANPHPIAIDFCEMFDQESVNIANSVIVWDPSANNGNGDYVSLSCSTGDVFIAPFQAFWVRTAGENPELEISESAYLENNVDGYFKKTDPSDRSERSDGFIVTLNVTGGNQYFTNQTILYFSEDGSAGLDGTDALKLSPEGLASRWLSFYSLDKSDRAYALQNLPLEIDQKVSIPLDIQTTESSRFTLDWTLPESHVFNGNYYLRDNKTGDVIELREGSSYSFEIMADQAQKASTHPMSDLAGTNGSTLDTHRMNSEASSRFELLIAVSGIDGFTELGAIPEAFDLAQNYPNPFNPTTVISYQLPVNSEVRMEVYDMLGRNVATLVNEQVAAGRHTVNFDASGLSSGVYLYRLQAGSQIMTRKLTVVK